MFRTKIIIGGIGVLALAGGLAACGSVAAPAAAPRPAATVTAAPIPTVTRTMTPAPTPTVTKTVVVAPGPVYVPAPAAPSLTYVGNGIYAGANTSSPFAQSVVSTWLVNGSPSVFDAYSTVTGQSYTMYASGSNPVVFRGGNNALVEYYG